MKPLRNYVHVQETKQEATTQSGIVLAGNLQVGSKQGLVLEVGPDVENIDVGDKVALAWEKALRITSDSALISDEFVLGVY